MRKIAILGFGREGKSVLIHLRRQPAYKDALFTVLDQRFIVPEKKAEKNVLYRLGNGYMDNLTDFDVVFRSPGVPFNLPQIQRAIKKGVKFSSETQLFFDEIKGSKATIVGITGTKGKGTVATLLAHMLKVAGKKVVLAGNIGKPMLSVLAQAKKADVVVLELSSFQLQNLHASPDVAVVLHITPDHLDAHKNVAEYVGAKASITKYQSAKDKVFYLPGNAPSAQIARRSKGKNYLVTSSVLKVGDVVLPGAHMVDNARVAASVAVSLGCSPASIRASLKTYKPLAHRLEFVRDIKGVKFYNDSAGTNPETAVAAVKAFSQPSILIAGGKDKGLNYAPLAKALLDSSCKAVVLFGENKAKIAKALKMINDKVEIKIVDSLASAVKTAVKCAHSDIHHSSFNIIFSPGSASFDMFKDYADRGEQFKKIVKKL